MAGFKKFKFLDPQNLKVKYNQDYGRKKYYYFLVPMI